ncbi:MAG: porin [Armatimonadota bacterium]
MNSLSLRHGVVLLAFVALTLLSLPAAAETKWTLAGYVQGRISETLGDGLTGASLDVRRAYFVVRASQYEHISGLINLWAYPNPRLLEAYGEYAWTPDLKARLGLTAVPFGYENPLSSARLITLERSQVGSKMIYPYTFDTGAFFYASNLSGLNFSVSATNGRPVDIGNDVSFTKDSNSTKNIVARVGYAIPGGQIGVSYWDGTVPTFGVPTPSNPADVDTTRFGADLQAAIGPVIIQAEYVTGETNAIDANGGYLTLAYQAKGSACQPYLRYDMYEPNDANPNDEFQRYTGGINYFLNPKTKLTLEYEGIDDDLTAPHGKISFQYQVVF